MRFCHVLVFNLCLLIFSRLSEKENELEQFRHRKLAEWKAAANNLQRWLNQQDLKLQSFDEISNDLDEVRQQKTQTEVCVKNTLL